MIKNNSLSDRLNEFKNNAENAEENNLTSEETNHTSSYINPIFSLVNSLSSLFIIAVKSIVFGYGIKTIMNLDWNFIGCLCVGMTLTFALDFILDLVALIRN